MEHKAGGRGRVEERRSLEVGAGPSLNQVPQSVKAQWIEEGAQHQQQGGESIALGTGHWAWVIFLFSLFIKTSDRWRV